MPSITDGIRNINLQEKNNVNDLQLWWFKNVALNKQHLVRWDVFEDHLVRFINKNVVKLFDDEIKREVAKVTEYKKNLG